jgi:calcineurin-like phosphoesterase family protein
MDLALINNWNDKVGRLDKVFCLGDFALSNKGFTTFVCAKLNGIKSLIMGNHDCRSASWYIDVGFDEVYKYPIIYHDFYILSHEPVYLNNHMPYVNIHGHLHSRKMDNKKYVNVSVENVEYAPVDFDAINNTFNPNVGINIGH